MDTENVAVFTVFLVSFGAN